VRLAPAFLALCVWAAPAAGSDRFFDRQDGKLDLSEFLEEPHGFLPVPLIVTEPAIGYGGGGMGLFLRPRKEAGAEGWSRPDMSMVGAIATENGTWTGFAADVSRWLDGRLRTTAGVGSGKANLDFYGLTVGRLPSDPSVRYSLQFSGGVAQANWQFAPRSPWSAGARYVYMNIEPTLREAPGGPGVDGRARVTVSAPTALIEYDSRDNVFTPTRGIYAETSYLVSRDSLGSSVNFERLEQVLLGWMPLSRDVTLGARANYAWSSNGTPFFARPYVMLRGVPSVRYQGEQAASVEIEASWRVHGRWSAVAFGGAGWTTTKSNRASASQDVASAGVGVRYEVARKFGMHVGADIAHSPGTTAIYLVVGSAWFRP
jgi:hypothetical protein